MAMMFKEPTHVLRNLHRCVALCDANNIHSQMVENACGDQYSDIRFGNHLMQVYDRFATSADARWVFNSMDRKNVISWNIMIGAYVQHQQFKEALCLFGRMNDQGVDPSPVTLITTLKACTKLSDVKYMYSFVKSSGYMSDVTVGNALVHMFAKCGSMELALEVFLTVQQKDFITWTTMIAAHIRNGQCADALDCFRNMILEGISPNVMTYATVLSACNDRETLDEGRSIQSDIIKTGNEIHEMLGASLLTMYGKCGILPDAEWSFQNTYKNEVVTWNSMMSAYIKNGFCEKAIQLFQQMFSLSIKPNSVTIICMLDACSEFPSLEHGMLVHTWMVDNYMGSESVWNALLKMYGNFSSLFDALNLFKRMPKKDVITWTTVIQIFAQNGCYDMAIKSLYSMEKEGIKPNKVTFVNILKACIDFGDITEGMLIHKLICCHQLEPDIVLGNTLISMYGCFGSPHDAFKVFCSMPMHDAVSWTAVVVAYSNNGFVEDAVGCLSQMIQHGIIPTNVTCISILDALISLIAVEEGKMIYHLIVNCGLEFDMAVGNAFINFFSKCGYVHDALNLFQRLPCKNTVTWSSMITAYAHAGKAEEAFNLLLEMNNFDIVPDDVTFISLLSAFSHAGLLIEGFYSFHLMIEDHQIAPSEEHYRCMVDLLSRAGLLNEAGYFVNALPRSLNMVEWMTLLGACRVHHDIEKAQSVVQYVLELDPYNPASYLTLSHLCRASKQNAKQLSKCDFVMELVDDMYKQFYELANEV